jgi:hypothetical protein
VKAFHIGQWVRLAGIPPGPANDADLQTRTLFEACVGKVFPIVGIDRGMIELEVGEVLGQPAWAHSIYVSPSLVKSVADERD